MSELFPNVLNGTIRGSIVIIVVLLLRLLLHRGPKKYICLLWVLVGFRLLNPFSIESGLSLQPNSDDLTQVLWRELSRFGQVVPVVWLVGAAVLLFYSVISYTVLKWRLREAIRIGPDVWESDRIDTAFILGYIRPSIYLPMHIQGPYRQMMLQHERCHLKRLDHWLKLLMFVTLAVHWFNPLVWVTYVLLCWDAEFACDELVISNMDLQERKAYSAALLACSSKDSFLGASPVAFGEKPIRRRIRAVLQYRKPALWVTVLSICAVILVAMCLLTNPKA